MPVTPAGPALSARLAESLYTEAMLLADETRAYFDREGRDARDALDPRTRVQFACEALKATTRLMHVIAWLLVRRAVDAGELTEREAGDPQRRLADPTPSDTAVLGAMPSPARRLVMAGIDLYERVGRFADGIESPVTLSSPARALMQRLENAF